MNQPPRARRPSSRKADAPRAPGPPAHPAHGVSLRLAIGKDGLGLELASRTELGMLTVSELAIALPKVKFPVDVSGGVARFRHRRGELLRLTVELDLKRLERSMRERLRGLLGTGTPETWVGLAPAGATLAVASQDGGAVAFDVVAASSGTDLHLYVTDARGVGLPRPAVAVAIEVMGALLGNITKRAGSSFSIDEVGGRVARALLPDAGVRVPSAEEVHVAALSGAADAWILHLSRGGVPLEPAVRVAAATETARILADCDDALAKGDWEAARRAALDVLGHAPRHPGACTRIAEVDRVLGHRTEAALAMLAEATGGETGTRTLLRGELLATLGDVDVGINALCAAGEDDPAPLFAARVFERAAELARDATLASTLLDRAVARAPTLGSARFRRLERRLELGRLEDAFADAEELEAQARGTRARYDVWRRSADAFLHAGLRNKAGEIYERSLRFAPDDALSMAGLGRALIAQGKVGRGVRLLSRAIDGFAAKAVAERDVAVIDLARVLSSALDDKPGAIARLEDIADASPRAAEARALEAPLRAALGDLAGATFAWARLRNYAESVAGERSALGDRALALANMLVSAARFELDARGDAMAAQRHLKTALRLAPNDAEAAALFRLAGQVVAEREGAGDAKTEDLQAILNAPAPAALPVAPSPASTPREPESVPSARAAVPASESAPVAFAEREPPTSTRAMSLGSLDFDDEPADAELEILAETLTRKLQADPSDDGVADELTQVLLRLGRSHEVFALVSARVDEATPERRTALREKQKAILVELAADARKRGNEAEAGLFESFVGDD